LLLYVGAASQVLPLLVVLALRRRPSGAGAWILGWTLLLVVQDAAALWLSSRGINNHWLRYPVLPVSGGLVLWALSLWQTHRQTRRALRVVIPISAAAAVMLIPLAEDMRTFSTVIEPLFGVLGLGAATFTLVARSLEDASGFARQDWFWTCAGLALYFGASSTLGPLAALLGNDLALLDRAYQVKSAADVIAFLAIARGITCRVPPTLSGASSSPPSFRSLSSSSPSPLR
jgi:hypothetical protein